MLASGTLAAGFHRPVALTAGPSGSLLSFHITLSAPDVGYAVWEQSPATALRLSVVCGGRLVVSDRLLVRDAVHNDLASRPGSSPTSPGFIAASLVVAVCKPALRCTAPRAVPFGDVKPACINPAVAISPDGTTTVIAAAGDWGATGCNEPLGIRASITHGRRSSVSPMRLIEPDGDFPVAEPVGKPGTVMVCNPGVASSDSLGWTWLSTIGASPSKPAVLDAGGLWNSAVKTNLAPAVNGWYVVAWTHANRNHNPQLSVWAAVAHNDRVEPASVAISAHPFPSQYVAAADDHGRAMILFNASTDTGNGAAWPYTSGLYATSRSP